MKTIYHSFLIFTFTLYPHFSSCASVDLRTASYSQTWNDFADLSLGVVISFDRTYSSRSLHYGVFGFGWCATTEKTAQYVPPHFVRVTECDHKKPQLIPLEPRPPARSMPMPVADKQGRNTITETARFGFFVSKNKLLLHTLPSGEVRTYNEMGRLIKIKRSDLTTLFYYKPGGNLDRFITGPHTWHVEYDELNEKIVALRNNKAEITFSYKGDLLIEARSLENPIVTYKYNDFFNLTEANTTNNKKTIRYDNINDRVVYVAHRNCQFKVSYNDDHGKVDVEDCSQQKMSFYINGGAAPLNVSRPSNVLGTFSVAAPPLFLPSTQLNTKRGYQ